MHIEGLLKLDFDTCQGALEQYISFIKNLLNTEKL